MTKTTLRILAIISAALLLFTTGCGGSNVIVIDEPLPSEGEINVCLGGEPKTIDPALYSSDLEASYIVQLFEGLTTAGSDGGIDAAAASEWIVEENEYGQPVYIFTLRDGLKWSDGEPLTAADFVYAWQRAADPGLNSPYGYLFAYIKNGSAVLSGELEPDQLAVEATGDNTLKVTLEGPCPYFISIISLPVFCPVREDMVSSGEISWSSSPSTCVGNGPYVMTAWNHDNLLTVQKNPLYRKADGVSVDRINFYMKDDPLSMYYSFDSGALQYISDFPLEYEEKAAENGTLTSTLLADTWYCVFNADSDGALADESVREALSEAFDRSSLAGSGVTEAYTFVPGCLTVTGLTDDFISGTHVFVSSFSESTLGSAKQALADAGYPGGSGLSLRFLTTDSEANVAMAQEIAAQWKENLGVSTTIVSVPYNEFVRLRASGSYDVVRGSISADFSDPAAILELFASVYGENWSGLTSYLEFINNSLLETSPASRQSSLRGAEMTLTGQAVVMPLLFSESRALTASGVTGIYLSPLGICYFRDAALN